MVWSPDILGAGFEQVTLELDGAKPAGAVATLVRRMPSFTAALTGALRDVDVLYVHGWSDYFFQTELARFWTRLGARFHAVDLRGYGRSLRDGQTPGYVADLDEYDLDIGAALVAMGHDPAVRGGRRRKLVLMGHSTGGLTLTLWTSRHPGVADALVLNSPWLELQVGGLARQALAPLVQWRAAVDPLGTHPEVDLGFYTRAQTEIGALPVPEYRAAWRPERGFPTHPGWLAAIVRGHARIAAGVDVGCPTLVMLSTRTTTPVQWNEAMTRSDSVLVVDDIAKAATRIGRAVTIVRITDGIHDLFLSRPEPRADAYAQLERWLRRGALR